MRLGLRAKMILGFVTVGLGVLLTASIVYYVSFKALVRSSLEAELIDDTIEFAESIEWEDEQVRVLDEFVWEDIDDELVEVVDTDFRTLKKSENLEQSLTELFNATPVERPIVLHAEIDDEKLICAIRPVVREDRIVAYVLLAESAEGAGEYVGILQEVILATLAFLVVFGAGMGYLIAGRLVRPMVAIQETIGEIDLRRLDRRIERVSDDPEVRSLVDTLNGLFERLERSYDEIANFSANVAHELHTPLTILRGTIEVTLSRERQPDEYVRILSDILEETLHTIHIVDSLLMLARSESAAQQPAGEPIRLHEFIDQQKDDWEVLCSLKSQQLVVAAQEDLSVSGDPSLLAQLLLNLVSNASKYSAEGQTIEVSAEAPDTAGWVHLVVEDSGIGISPDDHEKVFERFYRPKSSARKTSGAGLGLSICKVIAEAHGGSIGLRSASGKGTAVTVALPSS